MTASTVKSTNLGIYQASTGAKIPGGRVKAGLRVSADTIEAATTSLDETGDIILFGVVIPTSAIIRSVKIFSDDLDSDGTPAIAYDVGYFAASKFISKTSGTKTTRVQDVVLDADGLASAVTTSQAGSKVGEEVAFEAKDIAKINQTVWQDLGYDEDPGGDIAIGLTITTAADVAVAGTISILVEFSE